MEKNKKEIQFRIQGIREQEFFISNRDFEGIDLNKMNYELSISIQYKWNLDSDSFGIFMDIFLVKSKTDKLKILQYKSITDFQVKKLKECIKVDPKDKTYTMNHILEINLVSITYSSARGALYEKTKSSIPGGLILPLVIMNNFLSKGRKVKIVPED